VDGNPQVESLFGWLVLKHCLLRWSLRLPAPRW